jgi:hypothetical protein
MARGRGPAGLSLYSPRTPREAAGIGAAGEGTPGVAEDTGGHDIDGSATDSPSVRQAHLDPAHSGADACVSQGRRKPFAEIKHVGVRWDRAAVPGPTVYLAASRWDFVPQLRFISSYFGRAFRWRMIIAAAGSPAAVLARPEPAMPGDHDLPEPADVTQVLA